MHVVFAEIKSIYETSLVPSSPTKKGGKERKKSHTHIQGSLSGGGSSPPETLRWCLSLLFLSLSGSGREASTGSQAGVAFILTRTGSASII